MELKERYQRSHGVCFSFQKKKRIQRKGILEAREPVNCTNFFPLVSFSRRDSLKAFISLSFTL